LATEAATAVMQHGFDAFRFDRLISVINQQNRASIRVAEKLGMVWERSFTHKGIEVACYAKANPYREGGHGSGPTPAASREPPLAR
jgi:RimJ/RimL family protein N-acetyltransferase